jgi:uncharacterized protein (DUF2336 family)
VNQTATLPVSAPQSVRPLAAEKGDEAARVNLGASGDTAPDLLVELATDTRVTVRAAVAMNAAAPESADRILARDADSRVRALLARKLAALVPALEADERQRLQQHTLDVLRQLVEDEALRVRAAIADVLKEMPRAPHDLILRLAYDSEIPVSEPVTRLSPLLTPEDLLGLLEAAPNTAIATAVARRARLDENVADALVASADNAAIAALLANHSAAIREATLDALATRAVERPEWHAPFVCRPHLSAKAARILSACVAAQLLDELSRRAELPAALTGELRDRLAARLIPAAPAALPRPPSLDEAMDAARAMALRGELTEETLLGALQRGEARMASAMLAVAAGVPASAVERASMLHSIKGLVSLVWRAGFSMQVAGPLQSLLTRTPPGEVLCPAPGGGFPLLVEEMRWHLDFLLRFAR